jgi:hypothetical protein
MNENLTIIEIKKEVLTENMPKDQVYLWLSILSEIQEVERLDFQEMKQENVNGKTMNVRIFSQGDLRFDDFFARCIIHGNGQILMNESKKNLPQDINNLVSNFLNN